MKKVIKLNFDDVQGLTNIRFSSNLVRNMIEKISDEDLKESKKRVNYIKSLESSLTNIHDVKRTDNGFYLDNINDKIIFGGHAAVSTKQGDVEIPTYIYIRTNNISTIIENKLLLFAVDYYNGLIKYFS